MPRSAPEHPRGSWAAVALLSFNAGLVLGDINVTSVALVDASRALGFSPTMQAVAASVMSTTYAATAIASGTLSDRTGRRRVLIGALLLAALADVLVAASFGAWMYLLARAIAGVAMGAIFGASYAMLRDVAGDRIGAAMGMFMGVGLATSLVTGLAGGWVTGHSWRLAFLIIPVLAVVSAGLSFPLLPVVPTPPKRRVDWLGLTLIGVGMVGVLFGLASASTHLLSWRVLAPLLVGTAAFAAFVLVEARSDHAAFPIRLFASKAFIMAAVAGVAFPAAQSAMNLQLANLWQYVDRYETFRVTLGEMPFQLTSIVAALLVGQMLTRGLTVRRSLFIGFVAMGAGFATLSAVGLSTPYLMYIPGLVLAGVGIGFVSVPQGQLLMAQAPPDQFGPVTASKATISQVGFSLGMAGSSVVVSQLTFGGVTDKLRAAGVPPNRLGAGLDAVSTFVATGHHQSTDLARAALADAASSYAHAFGILMATIAVILIALAGLVLVLLPTSESQ